eukprot:757628-Hanusia_phi.AAC.3
MQCDKNTNSLSLALQRMSQLAVPAGRGPEVHEDGGSAGKLGGLREDTGDVRREHPIPPSDADATHARMEDEQAVLSTQHRAANFALAELGNSAEHVEWGASSETLPGLRIICRRSQALRDSMLAFRHQNSLPRVRELLGRGEVACDGCLLVRRAERQIRRRACVRAWGHQRVRAALALPCPLRLCHQVVPSCLFSALRPLSWVLPRRPQRFLPGDRPQQQQDLPSRRPLARVPLLRSILGQQQQAVVCLVTTLQAFSALYDVAIGYTLARSIFKFFLGESVELEDMKEIDKEVHSNLKWIVNNSVSQLSLTFEHCMESNGKFHEIPLKPGGETGTSCKSAAQDNPSCSAAASGHARGIQLLHSFQRVRGYFRRRPLHGDGSGAFQPITFPVDHQRDL